jgi:hypothetical protein
MQYIQRLCDVNSYSIFILYKLFNYLLLVMLHHERLNAKRSGEANKVSTNTEASTGSSRYCQAGNVDVQNSKSGSSNQRNQRNLVQFESARGNRVGNDSHTKTFNYILNKTLKKLTKIKCSVHIINIM